MFSSGSFLMVAPHAEMTDWVRRGPLCLRRCPSVSRV